MRGGGGHGGGGVGMSEPSRHPDLFIIRARDKNLVCRVHPSIDIPILYISFEAHIMRAGIISHSPPISLYLPISDTISVSEDVVTYCQQSSILRQWVRVRVWHLVHTGCPSVGLS